MTRFALLLLALASFPSRCVLSQEAAARQAAENPAPEQTVELDKPAVIGRIDDLEGDRSFTIDLTGTRIKDRS